MTEKERMLKGMLYIAKDEELSKLYEYKKTILKEFNDESNTDTNKKQELLKNLFKNFGKNSLINYPFRCDYGFNISVGDNFYANMDCIFLDVNEIIIGNNVMLGPRVNIFTAGHPIDKDIRNELLEYGYKVVIGNDVWIGGNVTINPGVKIGNNVVIGSGSVVTHDIEDNVIACGNPCKVIRKITLEDKKYWEEQKKKYLESFK
ncbi:MAG: sugar O-acetyltransferase [Candidatus Onthovivens sp.]|nr:sugar O-acetyltransferase [Candidatus Onthovivens sp.]